LVKEGTDIGAFLADVETLARFEGEAESVFSQLDVVIDFGGY